MDDWSSVRLCDVVNLISAVCCFFRHGCSTCPPARNGKPPRLSGSIMAVLSIAALAAFAVWEEWFNLIAGLVLIVSPWLLGFQHSDAMTIDVMIGVIVAGLAAFEVWFTRERSPASQAGRRREAGANYGLAQ